MDIHMHGNSSLHRALNGYRQTTDDGLQFLSTEEKECILFFENTIDSLEEDFNDDATGLSSRRTTAAEDISTLSSSALSPIHATNMSPSVIEHDIIDLVHSPTSFTMPDFQSLAVTPTVHDDMKPRREPVASSISFRPTSLDASEENGHHPPAGSIPTPVVIASKISEHQGNGGVSPSILIDRRRSMESKREQSMSAKPSNQPSHLPSNISMSRMTRDISPHTIATAAVSSQERRSQKLANLPVGAHPLEGGEPACVRNVPMRSVSFTDPTPNKSRMEALSKLGLQKDKPTSPTSSYLPKLSSNATVLSSSASANSISNKVSNAFSANYSASKVGNSSGLNSTQSPDMIISQKRNSSFSVTHSSPKNEISTNNFNSFGGKTAIIHPVTKHSIAPANQEGRFSTMPVSADVSNIDFNSYGGKSTVLIPSTSFKTESGPGAGSFPATPEPVDIKLNSYGGRSRVINPAHTDVPDELNAIPVYSPLATTPTTHDNDPNRSKFNLLDLNSPDAKPKVISPSQPDLVYQPAVRSKPATLPFTSSRTTKPHLDPVPPEILNKPPPSFRPQSVTVQFSGKGTTSEARRDALRRLGLLKNTS